MRLRWCEAAKSHRLALQGFVCTDPSKALYDPKRGRYHPTPWELEVQVHVHKRKVPVQFPERVLVGYDGSNMKAYIHFVLLEDENVVFVRAVACDYSSRGNRFASEAYEAMFLDLADLGWVDGYEVEGNIHRLNIASQKAFERAGGYYMEDAASDMEVWRLARPRART